MSTLRSTLWVLAVGVVGLYAFFIATGSFTPGEVATVSVVVAALAVALVVHALAVRRTVRERDVLMSRARERRGF